MNECTTSTQANMSNPIQTEIRNSTLYFVALILATLAVDAVLHLVGILWVGQWLGPLGLGLIVVSFVYTIRRRKWVTTGKIAPFLRFHEASAWLGTLMVLVHSGVHFNGLIAWAASLAMLAATASGLTGKYLLKVAQLKLKGQKTELLAEGMTEEEVADCLLQQARTVDKLKNWRKVHFPITLSFAFLVVSHLFGVFHYGWL